MIAFFIWTGVNTQHSAGFVVHVTRLALAFLGIIKPLFFKKNYLQTDNYNRDKNLNFRCYKNIKKYKSIEL